MEMEDLQWLDETIRRDFPQLECKMFDNDKFVRVAKTVGSTGLKFMPDFYLIFNSVNNGSFCLRLLTYNGRTLDTVMFRCDHDQEQLPEKVNNQPSILFFKRRLQFCFKNMPNFRERRFCY